MQEGKVQMRRALSPDARLIATLAAARAHRLERALRDARADEAEAKEAGRHPAALALARVDVVSLEEALARARIAGCYSNPDSN